MRAALKRHALKRRTNEWGNTVLYCAECRGEFEIFVGNRKPPPKELPDDRHTFACVLREKK